nr:reverse transcriptase domain-containing protein [Tanacetum cinerariifolium]
MSTRSSSSSNLIPPFNDPESVIRNRRRNLGDPSLLLDFKEINMNPNNVQGPPPARPLSQNHNGPLGSNLHMPALNLRTMKELCQPTMNGRGGPITRESWYPSLLLDFEEINMNPNNIQGPPPAGHPPQNHNGPPEPNLHMPAPDLRTMEELCQPTMNGRGGPIALVNIQATDFGLKNHMIQQVKNSCQFHGLSGDDANKHLDKFLIITQSMKQNRLGGTFIKRRPEECYDLIENMIAYRNDWDTSAHMAVRLVVVVTLIVKPPVATLRTYTLLWELITRVVILTNPKRVLPSNTVPTLHEDLKAITTWGGVTLAGTLVLLFLFLHLRSLTPSFDPVVASLSPSLTPFGDSNFILEEIDTLLAFDDSTSPNVDDETFNIEGGIRLIKTLLNNDISKYLPLPLLVFEINETKKIKTLIDDPPDLELKDLPPHLEYAFLEGTSKLPVIIAKDLKREEKEQLLKILKNKLTEAPILVSPDWDLPFELLCDASDFAVGAILGQRNDKYFRPMHYAMYTDHSALKYLFAKQDVKPRLLRWILLLQEFNIEIRDKKGVENLAANHLSRLENPHQGDLDDMEMNDNFPHESLNMISLNPNNEPPWFVDIANYLVGNVLIKGMSSHQKKKFFKDVQHYFWHDPYLFWICAD